MEETFSLLWEGGERPLDLPASLDCLSLGEVEDEAPPEGRRSWEEPGAGIPEGPGIRDTPGLLLPTNTYVHILYHSVIYMCMRDKLTHLIIHHSHCHLFTHAHYHKYVQYTCTYMYTTHYYTLWK